MEIEKATALITGANRGIGRALAGALLDAGVRRLYATARNLATLDEAAPLDDKRIVRLRADVPDKQSVAALADSAGDVNLLVNNAGILSFGGILDAPIETVESQFGTNFFGPLTTARAFAP